MTGQLNLGHRNEQIDSSCEYKQTWWSWRGDAACLVSQSPSFSFESKMGVRQSEELVQQVSQTGDIDWLYKTKGKLICCYRSFLFIQSIVENLLFSDTYRLLNV